MDTAVAVVLVATVSGSSTHMPKKSSKDVETLRSRMSVGVPLEAIISRGLRNFIALGSPLRDEAANWTASLRSGCRIGFPLLSRLSYCRANRNTNGDDENEEEQEQEQQRQLQYPSR